MGEIHGWTKKVENRSAGGMPEKQSVTTTLERIILFVISFNNNKMGDRPNVGTDDTESGGRRE